MDLKMEVKTYVLLVLLLGLVSTVGSPVISGETAGDALAFFTGLYLIGVASAMSSDGKEIDWKWLRVRMLLITLPYIALAAPIFFIHARR